MADGLSGPSAPSARLGGWWAACQGPRHLGAPHQSPPPLGDLSGGPPERGSSQRDDRLGFKVRVREGREVIHAEVPPRRGRLKDPRLNGNADLVRPRTEGRLNGLEHSGLEGALRLSGLVLCLSLLRGGLGLQELRRGPPPVRTQLIQQFFAEEVQVQILEE